MKVFISWSGEVSQTFAASLAGWLPNVIQAVQPFFSSEDIRKGARWFAEVGNELDESNFGILCVTPDNKNAPWLLFEAGALAKKIQHSHVCPLLLGINSAQIEGPLAQFQATAATHDEVWKLIRDINNAQGEKPLNETLLRTAFERYWSDLDAAIQIATATIAEKQKSTGAPSKRTSDDMLEELLNVSRGLGRQMEEIRMDVLSMPGFGVVDPFTASLEPTVGGIRGMAADYVDSRVKKKFGYGFIPPGMRPSSHGMRDTPVSVGDTIPPIPPNEAQPASIPENTKEDKKK